MVEMFLGFTILRKPSKKIELLIDSSVYFSLLKSASLDKALLYFIVHFFIADKTFLLPASIYLFLFSFIKASIPVIIKEGKQKLIAFSL